MTFTWKIPPWQRNEDCTHMAVMLTDVGGGQIGLNTESVRGDNATEALADLLMGPGGAGGGAVLLPGLVAIVVVGHCSGVRAGGGLLVSGPVVAVPQGAQSRSAVARRRARSVVPPHETRRSNFSDK
ncbi:hypothetical protein [Streptomyces sp. NPDC002545]